MKKWLYISILLLVLIIVSGILLFIYRNTSYLNFFISKEEVAQNNTNSQSSQTSSNTDLNKLVAKELVVPAEFKIDVFEKTRTLFLPEDFTISVYAANLSAPRGFDFDDRNNIYVAEKESGEVTLLKDPNDDGTIETQITVDSGLRNVHSIDYFEGDLYVGEEHQIVVYREIDTSGKFTSKEVIIPNLPHDEGHVTRTVKVGTDNKLYVTVGSSCNVCVENDDRRAAMVRYNLDGSGEEIFASGLRNTVDFTFYDNKIWGVDNGRDLIGDDIPPDEVNVLELDKDYGWPYCYGDGIVNPEFPNKSTFCKSETTFPTYKLQAHSAPLGIHFIPEDNNYYPPNLESNMIITFHGSWNRTSPTGYKVVRIDTNDQGKTVTNLITGWLDETGNFWGRPVGLGLDSKGILYISDDQAGVMYKLTYSESK